MKISTEIASAARRIGEQKTIELYAKAGFDAWDFSMFSMCRYDWSTGKCLENDHPLSGPHYLKFARELRDIGLDHGIHCNQSHAPFPVSCPQIRSYLKRAIECTAEAGGSICVIHPDNNKTPEENAQMYMELLPFAKECNVRIAAENMWNWNTELGQSSFAACSTAESFNAHLDAVNDEYMVACLDIGHGEMQGSGSGAANVILALGSRLQALHIHDNDRVHDSHQLPFTMDIDFEGVVDALRQIGYTGYFTLEADQYLKSFDQDSIFDGMKNMASCARKLADMFAGK
ncbi:MAG: sugar phosphate isomerase/epimerase [Oscillospiraceae bacterium]|nr:sugar phosphate isomerase/epimerase [Oscillospiraceae bacterium]